MPTCVVTPEAEATTLVDLADAFPPDIGWGRRTPMRVRAGGVRFEQRMPATLQGWLQTGTGLWVGCLSVPLHNGRGELVATVGHLASQHLIRLADAQDSAGL